MKGWPYLDIKLVLGFEILLMWKLFSKMEKSIQSLKKEKLHFEGRCISNM